MFVIDQLLPEPRLVPEDVQQQASGLPITEEQLVRLLASQRVQVVRVITRTYPKFHAGSPFKTRSIVSMTVRTGFIGADYLRVVSQQQKREGLFELAKMTAQCRPAPLWRGQGQHVSGNRHLVRHKRTKVLYLVLYPKTDRLGHPVESYRAFFTADKLQPVDSELVNAWRVVSLGSSAHQTKKKIPWRMPCIGSITSITIGGLPYTIIGERSKPMSASKRKSTTSSRAANALKLAEAAKNRPLENSQRVWEITQINAMGKDAASRLTVALNKMEIRDFEVSQIILHGSSFLLPGRKRIIE